MHNITNLTKFLILMMFLTLTKSKPANNITTSECPYPEEIGNGKCDRLLITNPLCDYDGGDCCGESNIGNKCCEDQNNFAICGDFDGGDCKSIEDSNDDDEFPNCPHNPKFIGDGVCDRHLAHSGCNFDGGDCCREDWIGNNFCDLVNNFENCGNFDGGDCRLEDNTEWPQCFHNPELIGNGKCDRQLVNTHCNFDGGDCCRDDWIGNKFCDFVNNFENCGNFDGGDCELKSKQTENNDNSTVTSLSAVGCPHNSEFIGDGVCDDHLKFNKKCNFDGGDCCKQDWIGDGVCDNFNMFQSCGDFDGGDCAFGSTIDPEEKEI